MKKYVLLFTCILCLLVFSGCSKTTGVMRWSDKYCSISADVDKTAFTKPSDAERAAYQEARAYCASLGQDIYVKESFHMQSRWYYTVKLIFRCIPEGAPDAPAQNDIRKVDVEML
jgi:hypothetical protein